MINRARRNGVVKLTSRDSRPRQFSTPSFATHQGIFIGNFLSAQIQSREVDHTT